MTEVGLRALLQVDGSVLISDSAALQNLSGLENLSTVRYEFMVHRASALTSLRGVEKLASVGQSTIGDCPKLIDLHAHSSLESVRIRCSLFRNEKLPTCEAE